MSLRPELPPLPPNMQRLPIDRGYPVPKFVAWVDGKPDFRAADARHLMDCVKFGFCWVCGHKLGHFKAFAISPMCAINRTSSEPPSHRDCAVYAAKACPFLVRPEMRRRERPEGSCPIGGHMIERNPGVSLVWVTAKFRTLRVDNGLVFRFNDPIETIWFREGRPATRGEVLESIEGGLPHLEAMASQDMWPDLAKVELYRLREKAMQYLPPG